MKILLILIISIFCWGCTPPTPEVLAGDVCDCFAKAKAPKNSDSQFQAISNCVELSRMNRRRIHDIAKEQDLDDKAEADLAARYDNLLNNCSK